MTNDLQDLREAVIDGDLHGARSLTQQLLADGLSPHQILNDGLIDGMSEVGELFKQG